MDHELKYNTIKCLTENIRLDTKKGLYQNKMINWTLSNLI